MRKTLGCLVHCIGFVVNSIGVTYGTFIAADPNGDNSLFMYRGWPGKFKYLTYWSEIIQFLYFGLAVLNDIFGSNTTNHELHQSRKSSLHRLRDNFHASIAFPVGLFVVTTFWMLYAINRELVFPKELDKSVPVWQNHIIHTLPIVWLLLEKMFVNISYPRRKSGLIKVFTFALIYQLWVLYIAISTNQWVYPVLRVLSWGYRMLFFVFLWFMLFGMFLTGEYISKISYSGPTTSKKSYK